MKMGDHRLLFGWRAVLGGVLAGLAPSLGGPLLMLPALALLWSLAERTRWCAVWGLSGVLWSGPHTAPVKWSRGPSCYGFGSTEEKYHQLIYGCRERGRQRDGPLDHATGKGWVKGVKGHYHDAIVVKRTRVCAMLVENLGGISKGGRAQLWALSERTKGRGAVDRTKYGSTRASLPWARMSRYSFRHLPGS